MNLINYHKEYYKKNKEKLNKNKHLWSLNKKWINRINVIGVLIQRDVDNKDFDTILHEKICREYIEKNKICSNSVEKISLAIGLLMLKSNNYPRHKVIKLVNNVIDSGKVCRSNYHSINKKSKDIYNYLLNQQ